MLKDLNTMSWDELTAERDRRIRNIQAGITGGAERLRALKYEITLRVAGLVLGGRVRSGAAEGGTFGWTGVVTKPSRGGSTEWVHVHWDGNVMPSSYAIDHPVRVGLIPIEEEAPAASATSVAQAISRVIDDVQEGAESLTGGLYLNEDEDDTLRVTEVGAQLHSDSTGSVRSFYVKTSDGKEFRVSVQEV